MILYVDDDSHERLWRICDALVSAGARAAMICDAANGSVLISVGDASAAGTPQTVETLGDGERVLSGEAGQVYGVDVPGGAMLVVLHDAAVAGAVREAARVAIEEAAEVIARLPPPPPPPKWPPQAHDHDHPPAPAKRKATSVKAPKKKSAPRAKGSAAKAKKIARPAKASRPAKKPASPARKPAKKKRGR